VTAALVTAAPDLQRVVEQAGAAGRVGLDTEFMRERTYSAQLCLVQIAFEGAEPYLIDTTGDLDLAPVAKLVGDTAVQVIIHSGRQDLEIFHDLFGTVPANVFDVQLAAGFAGLGASLPYGRLVQETTGTALQKGEAYTDWCRRPLTADQVRYAADDVRYLLAVADDLAARLERLDRTRWVMEEMRAFEDPAAYNADAGDMWKRVSGRGNLSRNQLTVLKEVARWREETARRRNIPRGWVIKDATLIEIARRSPTSLDRLKDTRGLNAKEVDRSGRDILAAVAAGKAGPPMELEPAPARSAQVRARMLAGLADAIVRARCEHAEIATELVTTRGELELLLAQVVEGKVAPARHRLLQGWRKDLAGNAVVALAEGRIAVRAIPNPPYVEEVEL
jgi:ribonuclease D